MTEKYWKCPKCGTENKEPPEDKLRIMILKEEWDFCRKCGWERHET